MKFDRKLFSVLLAAAMIISAILPVSAAQLEANYGEARYFDIAVEAYTRMLLFHDGVVAAANTDRQYGLITASGEIRVDFQYDGIEYLTDNMFTVEKDGQYGIIDSKGEILIPITHRWIELETGRYDRADGSVVRNSYIYIDGEYYTADQSLTPVSGDQVNGRELDEVAQRLGYDYIASIDSSHYYAYRYDRNSYTYTYYYLDKDFNELLHAEYLSWFWNNDELCVYTSTALYNANVEVICDFSGTGIEFSRNMGSYLLVRDTDTGEYGAVDLSGKEIIPCKYKEIGGMNQQGYIAAIGAGSTYVGTDLYRLDSNGEPVNTFKDTYVSTEVYYRHLVYNTSEDGAYGMMDIDGNVLLPTEYTLINTDKNGNLLVMKGDYYGDDIAYGLRNQDGGVIFADNYKGIAHLGNNYYRMRDNNELYGVMRTDGSTVIPFSYKSITYLDNGYYILRDNNNLYGAIRVEGSAASTVIPFDYLEMRVHTTSFIELYDGVQYKIVDLTNNTVVRESNEIVGLFTSNSDLRWDLEIIGSEYDGWLPFCIETDEGVVTVYANHNTGETFGELASRASGINDNKMFVYQDAETGLFGFGTFLGDFPKKELSQAVKYVPYSHTLNTGAKASEYNLVAGSLPQGLELEDKAGVIYGVPMENGTFEFTIQSRWQETEVATVSYQLTVQNNDNAAVQRPNDYEITEYIGTQDPNDPNGFLMTEYRDETLIIDGPYQEFYRLLIDGVEKIKDVDYTAREGSTVITILSQTFRDVGEGTHTIAVEFHGTDDSGNVTVKVVAQNYTMNSGALDNTPQTGDNSMMTVWIVLALTSLMGMGATVLYIRKVRH